MPNSANKTYNDTKVLRDTHSWFYIQTGIKILSMSRKLNINR